MALRTTQRLDERGPARRIRHEINRLWDAVKALKISPGVGYKVKNTEGGQILQIKLGATTAEVWAQRFKVTAIESKYLTCRKVDKDGEEISSEDYKVMRPRCTWHADEDSMLTGAVVASLATETDTQSRTYNVTRSVSGADKTFSATQEIFPEYNAGSLIYGINNVKGGTTEVDSEQLKWIDLNVDARHWRLIEQATEVCVDGVTQYALFPRTDTTA